MALLTARYAQCRVAIVHPYQRGDGAKKPSQAKLSTGISKTGEERAHLRRLHLAVVEFCIDRNIQGRVRSR